MRGKKTESKRSKARQITDLKVKKDLKRTELQEYKTASGKRKLVGGAVMKYNA